MSDMDFLGRSKNRNRETGSRGRKGGRRLKRKCRQRLRRQRVAAFEIDIESRDDRTPIELFIAGVQGWEAGLRRQIEDGKPKLE